jgi:hypothetical protein
MALTDEDAKSLADRCQNDPVFFCNNILGTAPWAKQREIMCSVRDNPNTIVASGHGLGKTRTAAETCLWFLFTHPNSYVITTAPTARQMESILWAEIGSLYNNAKVPLGGRLLRTSLTLDEKWFALGLSTDEGDRFQGFHAENILLIMDEAPAVEQRHFSSATRHPHLDHFLIISRTPCGKPSTLAVTSRRPLRSRISTLL